MLSNPASFGISALLRGDRSQAASWLRSMEISFVKKAGIGLTKLSMYEQIIPGRVASQMVSVRSPCFAGHLTSWRDDSRSSEPWLQR